MSQDEKAMVESGGNNIMPSTGSSPAPQGGAMVQQETQRAIAEVQAAILLAKQFPRNQKEAMDRVLMACKRPTLAAQALYSYPRGGTNVTGPSIRMAEALAQNWGNLQFGIRELEQKNGESTVEAFAWDVETNTRQVKVFQVPHERHTKQGKKKLTDPRDIYEMVANQGARRLRACILGVIPGDVIDEAVKECEQTMKANVDMSKERIKAMLEKFLEIGVTKKMIEERMGRNIESITPALFIDLGKIMLSINDGMSQPADWFGAGAGAPLEGQVKPKQKPSEKETEEDTGPTVADLKAHCKELGLSGYSNKNKDELIAMIEEAQKEQAAPPPEEPAPAAEADPDDDGRPFTEPDEPELPGIREEYSMLYDLLSTYTGGDDKQMEASLKYFSQSPATLAQLEAGEVPLPIVEKAIKAIKQELEQ